MVRGNSEIPEGYEIKDESKDIKYRAKKNYSAEQVARRIRRPKELSGDYEDRAGYHESMAGIHEMGNDHKDYESAARHRKKAHIYRQIAKKAKKGNSVSDDEISRLERLFDSIGVFAIISLFLCILFFQPNITGNIIGLGRSSSNYIGGVFLIIGLVGAFIYFRNKY